MKPYSHTEKFWIQEITQISKSLKYALKGASIGQLIKTIRNLLGMSQTTLAKRAKVPQATISRIEQGHQNASLGTLQKICEALSCELVIVPLLQDTIEAIRQRQAQKMAKRRIDYLKGTMSLEMQEPDSAFLHELLKQEEIAILRGPNSKLWEE